MSGKQIKLFLVDGSPGGLTTAEITNWTGHVLVGGRAELGELLKRDEVQRTGLYLLLGEDESAVGEMRCYIGEADVVAERLRMHAKQKDFWDRVVVVSSKDSNLTKAHVRYLESRLVALATAAGRVSLENGTVPARPRLPEADASDMDFFLAQLQIVLPVLGVNAVRVKAPAGGSVVSETSTSPVFGLSVPKSQVEARAQLIDGEFTVIAGSRLVASWTDKGTAESTRRAYAGYALRHRKLLSDGTVRVDGGVGVLTRDVVFSSPSLAGAVLLGRSCNGRISWVDEQGGTFGEWEDRDLPA